LPDNGSSSNYIDIALQNSGYNNPKFVLIDGNNPVRKTNLLPLFNEIKYREMVVCLVHKYDASFNTNANIIFIGAHVNDIKKIEKGYKIHIDHDLKAPSTANLAHAKRDYKRNNYFQNIDLHITAGEAGKIRTQYLLLENHEKVIVGGYPKAMDYLNLNNEKNKLEVCTELGFDPSKHLVTYAPAGKKKYMKPGGSFNESVLVSLREIEKNLDINILVKLKYSKNMSVKEFFLKLLKYMYSQTMKIIYSDGEKEWDDILQQIKIENKMTGK
jgi:hypothetical protein